MVRPPDLAVRLGRLSTLTAEREAARSWMPAARLLWGQARSPAPRPPGSPAPSLLQTLCTGTWRSRAPSSWPASWRRLPASPRTARASSPGAVWTWRTPTPPVPARACVAQAASGAGTRTGAPAACGAGTGPTAAPSAEAWLARAHSPPSTGAQGRRGGRVLGALEWQPPSSWGPSLSARASSSPWPGSSTSSAAVNCPGSATGGTEPPPCSPAKPPR